MRRPALIFDFGNVVAHFDYGKAAAELGARLGISGEELLDRIRRLGFSEILKSYESGQISGEAFSQRVSKLIGLEISHEEFQVAWADIFSANDSLTPVLASLKAQGYTLVLGSNTNEIHAGQFRRQFAETLGHFDRLILSYEVGHLKPSSLFYLACAEAAVCAPEDCVFIDDLLENIEGAKAAGLVGLHYRSTELLVQDLKNLGVKLPHNII